MAKDKSKKKNVEPETTEPEVPTTNNGLERVINRAAVQPNWAAFSEFVVDAGGPKINPKHVGIVLTGYKYFQKSDSAVSAREESAQQKAAAREEREAAREAKAKERAERAAEREERKAEREKAAKEKAAKATKSPAAASKGKASKPTPKATAGKAAASKKAASKKKGGAKSAF